MVFYRSSLNIVLAGALWASGSNALANQYLITDLGVGENPVGINKVGIVVGNIYSPRLRGQIFRGGVWHNLPARTQVAAVNRSGNSVGIDNRSRPTFWPHNEDAIAISLPDNADEGAASGLNDNNMVVGGYFTQQGALACYSWTPSDGAIDFGQGMWRLCVAMAINNAGQITGEAEPAVGVPHAFLWTNGQFDDLGIFQNATSSEGLSVNIDGQVVGVNYTNSGSIAFLWNGALVSLDPSRVFAISVAASINDSGEIVGWTQLDEGAQKVAVRFAHSHILRLDHEVVDLGDWQLLSATAINNKGVIVGYGVHEGLGHAFMLTPQ